jgi:hypothetical protein
VRGAPGSADAGDVPGGIERAEQARRPVSGSSSEHHIDAVQDLGELLLVESPNALGEK